MMLCAAATSPPGRFNVLDVNWKFAEETAAEFGHVDGPREAAADGPDAHRRDARKARENVRFGLENISNMPAR